MTIDADSIVATLCDKHQKFREWWDELGERRAMLFMRALQSAIASELEGGDEKTP